MSTEKLSELSNPSAEVVSKFGDPEAFGERELKVLADIQKLAYGTKFYSQEYVSALLAELAVLEAKILEGRCIEQERELFRVERTAHQQHAQELEKRIAELEASETQLIQERDSTEQALADMYEAATGERPEWSNWFGFADAIEEVAQVRAKLANREAQTVQVTDGMALDFHHALTDGSIGSDELEEIKVGLRAALCNVTATPAPAVPEEMLAKPVSGGYKLAPIEPTEDMIAAAMNCDEVSFNADETFCVNFGNIYAAMLAAAPESGNG
ncbi:TPA: hypothetical protein ACGD7R_002984 [Serratia marcescens]